MSLQAGIMIEFGVLIKVLSIFVLALISPGPDFMIVSSLSLTRGRSDGVKAAAGIASVIFLYTLVSLTGLSALFARYFWVTVAIKMGGGLYLVYLGTQLWRASLAKSVRAPLTAAPKRKNAYLTGVLTCLTNPKAIAFFASIFAFALTPQTELATKAALAAAVPLTTFFWFSFVAFGLSKNKVRARYQRWQRVIDRVTGTALAFFGVKLLLSARS
jgi:RhtB (resistance to homoserine/threonine) family protein